jgi:mannose-6-phosphate isomerase-like protein (cupin superfamily)
VTKIAKVVTKILRLPDVSESTSSYTCSSSNPVEKMRYAFREEKENSMESKVGQNLEEVPIRFNIGGMIGEVIEWPESNQDGSLITHLTLPPESGKFLASPHRHYTQEENTIIAGRAEVTRGYDDHLETLVLGPGDSVLFGPNEWHAIRNLSDQEDLITRQVQTPGDRWAHMIRVGAEQIRQTGHLPPDFQKWYFEYIGIEFHRRGN